MCTALVCSCSPRLLGGRCYLGRTLLSLIECSAVRMLLWCWLCLVLFRLLHCCSRCFRFLALAFHPFLSSCLLSARLSLVTASGFSIGAWLAKEFQKTIYTSLTPTICYVQSCILIYKTYTHGALSSCFVNEASHFYMATHSSHAEYENHPHMVLPSSSLQIVSCLYKRTIIICTKQSAALEIFVRTENSYFRISESVELGK
jgi:hypothetical protein